MPSPAPSALPRPLLLGCAVLSLVVGGCGRSGGEAFPVPVYLEAPDNLLGNRYSLDAEIDSQLRWQEGVGRLVAVRPLEGDSSARLPLFVADSLQSNLMVAQRYRFEISVGRGGLLTVVALRKL
jgi:hypothetical protein